MENAKNITSVYNKFSNKMTLNPILVDYVVYSSVSIELKNREAFGFSKNYSYSSRMLLSSYSIGYCSRTNVQVV